MSNIEFQAPAADIDNINIRKKGKEAQRQSIIDVTMDCEVPNEVVKSLALSENIPELWDSNGDKSFNGFGSITSIIRCENHTIKIGDLLFEDVELKSFSFQPIGNNRALVRFTVTLYGPTEHQTGVLVDSFKESVSIDITPGKQMDIEDQE